VQGYLTSGRPAVCVETFAALSTEEAITRFEKAGIGTARQHRPSHAAPVVDRRPQRGGTAALALARNLPFGEATEGKRC
jgi:hypothetical protein